jgi:UDP-N-acetylmuramoyl-tripeptide--D-alanyl-D-alanine ligase
MLKRASTEELYKLFLENGQRVCTDTRKPEKGSIFFALKGPNFNANGFAVKALEAGCAIAVVDEDIQESHPGLRLVNDVTEALQDLARHHRRQFDIPVLAITGSNAKTTTKELTHAVLSRKYKTLATAGNLNNHLGVPLTLLKLDSTHEFAIIEMGANHQGEIDLLCRIAEPSFGLITNIGHAHLEGFGGFEGVKKGKGEMFRYLEKNDGTIFVNCDDPALSAMTGTARKITYGTGKLYDVIGLNCTTERTVSFKFTTRYGKKAQEEPLVNTKMVGTYNYINCLAAASVGIHFKVPGADIVSALETYTPEMNRSQLVETGRNTIILDAYNANPDSMKAAIENFASYKASKKMLLLGDMYELGEESQAEHARLIELLQSKKFDDVLLVGDIFVRASRNVYKSFGSTAECRTYLEKLAPRGYTVLIKGSRAMKMETLRESL